jgi:hypothetical protein
MREPENRSRGFGNLHEKRCVARVLTMNVCAAELAFTRRYQRQCNRRHVADHHRRREINHHERQQAAVDRGESLVAGRRRGRAERRGIYMPSEKLTAMMIPKWTGRRQDHDGGGRSRKLPNREEAKINHKRNRPRPQARRRRSRPGACRSSPAARNKCRRGYHDANLGNQEHAGSVMRQRSRQPISR